MQQVVTAFSGVPRISAFYGIVITMNWREHGPPHFHASYGGFQAAVAIEDGRVLWGKLPPRAYRLVHAWTQLRGDGLAANWKSAQALSPLHRIEPLP